MDAEPRPERRRATRGPGPLGPGAKRFNVWIPRQLFAKLQGIAERNQVAPAVVIRDMLRRALAADQLSHKKSSSG